MSELIFKNARSESELIQAFGVMKELRPHLNLELFLGLYNKARERDEYEIVLLLNKEHEIISLMGYRILFDYVHGKHLYIDDLITVEKFRSKGHGAHLLHHAEKLCKEKECKGLRLCTGTQNVEGIKFYQKNNWLQPAIVFKKGFK